MEESKMTAELLASIVAIVLSLLFSYIPGVKEWFDKLSKSRKQTVMGVLLIVVAATAFGLSCGSVIDVGITCDKAGVLGLVGTLIAALIANQSIYSITKK